MTIPVEFLARVAPHLMTLASALLDRTGGNVAQAVSILEATASDWRAARAAVDAAATAKFHPPGGT